MRPQRSRRVAAAARCGLPYKRGQTAPAEGEEQVPLLAPGFVAPLVPEEHDF